MLEENARIDLVELCDGVGGVLARCVARPEELRVDCALMYGECPIFHDLLTVLDARMSGWLSDDDIFQPL